MKIYKHHGSASFLLVLLLSSFCFSASVELPSQNSNIKTNTGSDTQPNDTSAPLTVTNDNKNTNPTSVTNLRQSLREQLRKKLISSLSLGLSSIAITTVSPPAPVTKVTTVLSTTAAPAVVISSSPNNAQANNSQTTAPPQPAIIQPAITQPVIPQPVVPQPVISQPVISQTTMPLPIIATPPQNVASELAKKQQDVIDQVKTEIAQQSLSTKIETIFSRLPQSSQLDSIILTADSYALVKTVQQASESTLSCEQKVSYLSDFFGRIQTAVRMKNFTLNNLNVVIEAAKTEIKRLTQDISRSNDDISNLGLEELKRKLNEGLLQLSTAYGNYNRADSMIEPKKSAIAKSQATIEDYKKKIDANRDQIPVKKLELVQINSNISLLEQQLSDAKARKSVTEAYLATLDQNIKTFEQKLTEQKNNSVQMETELSRIYDESDRSKSKYKVLEVEVERLRTEIAQKSQKEAEIQGIISNLQGKISAQSKKIDVNQQSRLQSFIKDLKQLIPSVQVKIDQINYRCNEVKQIEPISLKSGEMILFLITPRDLNAYIQASYQIKQDLANLKPIKISLISSNILDRAWQDQLGNPYISPLYYQSSQFTFSGDFNCLAPSELETGSGIIAKVTKKFIEVDGQSMRYLLNLGACTRIESPQQVPLVGQRLYFRGRRVQQGEYNAYKLSCF